MFYAFCGIFGCSAFFFACLATISIYYTCRNINRGIWFGGLFERFRAAGFKRIRVHDEPDTVELDELDSEVA